ncbi:MAG: large subunit ribosomal protein [Clostridia bacterium]|nr:ribosomal protein [Clostridiales bacterium]MDK2985311.1 large subunit ribosomal protein [Clostridia bacterium]
MYKKIDRKKVREKKHLRIRNKIIGTPERPRLTVFKSNKNIYAQIIDDTKGHTLVAASSLDPALRGELESGNNVEAARKVGELLAKNALEKGIEKVVFDRSGYIYHGKIAALADGAREGGLKF